jgi:hypothetical protein
MRSVRGLAAAGGAFADGGARRRWRAARLSVGIRLAGSILARIVKRRFALGVTRVQPNGLTSVKKLGHDFLREQFVRLFGVRQHNEVGHSGLLDP